MTSVTAVMLERLSCMTTPKNPVRFGNELQGKAPADLADDRGS